jgi:hypothetical protein
MPNVDNHADGSFSWIELGTSDQNAAKGFYTSLFGWTFQDSPMGPTDFYTMFQLDNRNVGAAYTLREQETSAGVPPHWNLYIAVSDADASAQRAAELGGKVLAPPFDVFTFGRMAVIQDPTGATFAIWQAKEHTGIGITERAGTLCWADLNTPDRATAQKFYSGLFGWTFDPGREEYIHIKNGDKFIGGSMPAPPNVPPSWMIYLQVEDCDVSTEKAKALGGQVCMGPTTIENAGRMSVISDPQGAVFALFQSMRHS